MIDKNREHHRSCMKGGRMQKGWHFHIRAGHTSERYPSAIFLDKKFALLWGEVNFISKSVVDVVKPTVLAW